jgi:hypothetical protein
VPYSGSLAASGATAPYAYAITAGSLPSGVVLSSGGIFSGAPKKAAGGKTYAFTVRATDNNGCTGTRSYSLAIAK